MRDVIVRIVQLDGPGTRARRGPRREAQYEFMNFVSRRGECLIMSCDRM